ncbi:Hsp70 family protein [Rhodobacter sp. KR11]|uniref:Hsp70 family protein n=1 Tax=Rhodobacter sp. KR11 TaxID=2974588 RepID=UPI0022231639|nr:Hsp70 family protein [Rhodobacter sp. KR11]MCW1919226.1 Hsp70 family protein [Rhodobacter sp. KR11]
MDFGTSTTVVSAVSMGAVGEEVAALVIEQPDQYGVTTRHHLVNTVIAYVGDRLIFGREAYRQRSLLHDGRNVFSSFKMRLGVDIGPTYPETALRSGVLKSGNKIESAQDAAAMFFRFIKLGTQKAIEAASLPKTAEWCVSVPASFEANQRKDLEVALREAGIVSTHVALIDEPNAAFLSYLFEAAQGKSDAKLLTLLQDRPVNVIVFDFGAGTCDVSALKLERRPEGLESRNLAISRFTALGGDDIDLAIARKVLLPQLLEASSPAVPSERDIEERILPRLQPTAELLKIRLLEHARDKNIQTIAALRQATDLRVTALDIEPFRIGEDEFQVPKPGATLIDLANALEPFTRFPLPTDDRTPHVFAPVQDALEKSGLAADDLDAVLFIGGSSENTIVRHCIMTALGSGVEAIVPKDLRSHVSKGAALHSYWFHGCGFDFIQPITSEPILALARGGDFKTILPSSTPLPSGEIFSEDLIVLEDGQKRIEIPICVSSPDKLLGVLVIDAPEASGFRRDTRISIAARISRDKLLQIEARVGDQIAKSVLLDPMANRPLSEIEAQLLKAKQEFNQALLKHGRRLPVSSVIAYANAAQSAGDHRLAAELFQKAEQMEPSRNFAVAITYNYAMAGKDALSELWARKAYEREPSAASAYNLALDVTNRAEKEALLREALRHDPDYSSALLSLGRLLQADGKPEGTLMLEALAEKLGKRLNSHRIDESGCRILTTVSRDLGQTDLAREAEARARTLASPRSTSAAYSEDNLAGLARPPLQGT